MRADGLLAEGKDVAAVCRERGVPEATHHRWPNQFGGLKAEDAKQLKDIERESATLKRLLANAEQYRAVQRHRLWRRRRHVRLLGRARRAQRTREDLIADQPRVADRSGCSAVLRCDNGSESAFAAIAE